MVYPEGLHPSAFCYMEGCIGNGRCPRCGNIDYALMGYFGAIALWAKKWGVSKDEAACRIAEHERERFPLSDVERLECGEP